MPAVILSPHLDDAVLSCWHLLEASREVSVINVFTASPAAGRPIPWWDRLTGASDAVARMEERRAEDRAALALAGCEAVSLGLLDDQYRTAGIGARAVLGQLRGALAADTTVYAPAAMDAHRDHVLVRDAALSLAREGTPLVLYADLPHAIPAGWPSWVTGEHTHAGPDPGAAWRRVLDAAGLLAERLVPRVRPLDAEARARKLAAVNCYGTQREALDRYSFAPLADPRVLAWEVYWEVPPSALRGPHEPRREDRVVDALGQASCDGG